MTKLLSAERLPGLPVARIRDTWHLTAGSDTVAVEDPQLVADLERLARLLARTGGGVSPEAA
ncbi:hypothetical protein P3T36_003353 [Kitasatospora sp. MAP12-15]|uniref:hypothetical protein n=1 Tax=unclassified Kitasatospora TaxID=2633591 RepID=UPI002476B289|nr:hypothetical protein [Kitasatospora sp. MAP12-44]MDH6111330.1 hypothetical protein [Kitasatospora sp. MAP12-44]